VSPIDNVPSAPGKPTGIVGNGVVSVSWTAPSSTGGSAITGYTVTAAPGVTTCSTNGALTCDVTGLTNGTSYTFTVVASNVNGAGSTSPASDALVPRTVPGAPAKPTAVPGDSKVSVSWTAPANGGSAITGYTVTAAPSGLTCSTTGALTCDVTGLTNGVDSTFTVVASNIAGDGAASPASDAVRPRTVPGAPGTPTGVPGHLQVAVSWTAPSDNGGVAVTGYVVTASPGGHQCSTSGALTCTVTGLVDATQYTFTVVASNVAGLKSNNLECVASKLLAKNWPKK
jgi:hypothetical protein